MNKHPYDACAEYDNEWGRYRFLVKLFQETEMLEFASLPDTRKLLTAACFSMIGCLERMGWADEIVGF